MPVGSWFIAILLLLVLLATAKRTVSLSVHSVISSLLICCLMFPSLAGCNVRTYSDLPAHVPRAWVCARMPQVEPDARYWAMHLASNTIISDDDPEAFDEFVPYADVVYIYDSTARAESVHAFPIPYNLLSCDDPNAVLPRAVDLDPQLPDARQNPLRNAQWDPLKTSLEDTSPGNLRFVANVTDKKKNRGPEIIRVCTHPPDVRSDAKEWLFTTEKVGASYMRDPELYARLRPGAKRVYIFDPDAPAESVLRFPAPHNRLRCPGKPLLAGEIPGQVKDADTKAAFDAQVTALTAKASASEFGGTGGSAKQTWTSTPEGTGAGLSFFEDVVRQMVIAGAFKNGDTHGNLKDPNGSRYGIPQGKNIGGPNSLALQLVAGTFMMLSTPLRSTAAFAQKIAKAAKGKGILIITNPAFMPKELAEKLVQKYGQDMAPSLHQLQTIIPYSRAKLFTAGWGHVYQAHHILEEAMMRDLGMGSAEHVPAIILKDAEHKFITAELKAARERWFKAQTLLGEKGKGAIDKQGLWEIYQAAYKDHPDWLRSIKSYFE